MSVCDEGWYCPLLKYTSRNEPWCGIGLFDPLFESNRRTCPDSCPHASALKAVVENPELVLVAAKRGCENCQHFWSLQCHLDDMCKTGESWEARKP